MNYSIEDKVVMTEDALQNYGEEYRDKVFTIIHAADNKNDHPGYDDGVYPMGLYDLDGLEYSLYDWELEYA